MKKLIIFLILMCGISYLPAWFYRIEAVEKPVEKPHPLKVKLRNINWGLA
jgi:hypothetical protein